MTPQNIKMTIQTCIKDYLITANLQDNDFNQGWGAGWGACDDS